MEKPRSHWMLPHPRRIYRFMRSKEVPGWRKGVALVALAYVVFPFDAVPDMAPLLGWLDDLGVAGGALTFLSWAMGDPRFDPDDKALREAPSSDTTETEDP